MGLLYINGRPIHDVEQRDIEALRVCADHKNSSAVCECLADESYPKPEVQRALYGSYHLSAPTIEKLIDTLRYLKREFDTGFRIDAINMRHVDEALMRVDIETSTQRAMRAAE